MSAVMLLEPQSVSAAMSNSDVSYAFDGSSSTEQRCHSSDSELIDASDQEIQLDSDSVENASSSRGCSQSQVQPVRQLQPKPKARRPVHMRDEVENGVRVKVIPCPKEQFRRRLQQTNRLRNDFFVPNRAQFMLDFLRKHGHRIVKEKHTPKRRFSTTLQLVQHALSSRSKVIMHRLRTELHLHVERRNSVHQLYTDAFPPRQGCVCVSSL